MATVTDTRIPVGAVATLLDRKDHYLGRAVTRSEYSVAEAQGWALATWYDWRKRETRTDVTMISMEDRMLSFEISDGDGGLLSTVGIVW